MVALGLPFSLHRHHICLPPIQRAGGAKVLRAIPFHFVSSSPLSSDVPSATLLLGSSLNASNIKEGDDVYFECESERESIDGKLFLED